MCRLLFAIRLWVVEICVELFDIQTLPHIATSTWVSAFACWLLILHIHCRIAKAESLLIYGYKWDPSTSSTNSKSKDLIIQNRFVCIRMSLRIIIRARDAANDLLGDAHIKIVISQTGFFDAMILLWIHENQ